MAYGMTNSGGRAAYKANQALSLAQTAKETADEAKEAAEHGGGGSGVELADVTAASATASNETVTITWTDPADLSYNGGSLARWAGTKLVRKTGSAPTSVTDGTVVVDSKTRSQYASTGYADTGLTNGTTYYYRLFPYTDVGTVTKGTDLSATPNKLQATISVSPDTVTLSSSSLTGTATITSNSDGAISIVSSDVNEDYVQVSLSGNTITLTAVDNGSATITISQADGTDYSAPNDITLSVTVSLIPAQIEDATASQVQDAIDQGKAATLWSVGDKIGIALNGTVGKQSFSNQTFYASILGFDHNKATETGGKSSVHFIFGKNASGTDIAFCDFDGTNWSQGSDAAFRMNLSNTTTGGWNSSYMRQTICQQFISAMPQEWRSIIGTVTKYTDNTGGSSTGANQVTATQDKIFLLSEWEVHGARTYANESEKNYQAQYAYYANGNSKVRKNHRDGTTAVLWWLRSVSAANTASFCFVNTSGSASTSNASYSFGFAPGFALIAQSA